jgi:hypothetical protein
MINAILTYENDMDNEVDQAYNNDEYIMFSSESEVMNYIKQLASDLDMTVREVLTSFDYNNMSDNAIIKLNNGGYMVTCFC